MKMKESWMDCLIYSEKEDGLRIAGENRHRETAFVKSILEDSED